MTKSNRDVTVNAVEFRRNVGRALSTFKVVRDAALDMGRGRSEATIAAAATVRHLFPDVDIMAALGIEPEAAQGAAGRAAGGDDADPASSHPGTGEVRHGGALPPRSRDRNRLFVDLIGAELGPDLNDAIDRLAEFWDREPDAERLPGDDEFRDDADFMARGDSYKIASEIMQAMARSDNFTAEGWTDSPERDPDHASRRLAMLEQDFLVRVWDLYDIALDAGFADRHRAPGRVFSAVCGPAGIATAFVLGLERGEDGAFRVPAARGGRNLRAV